MYKNKLKVEGSSKPHEPAEKTVIKKGNVIKSIDGILNNDIYEYMDRLEELEPGITITVLIDRNGTELKLPVTF